MPEGAPLWHSCYDSVSRANCSYIYGLNDKAVNRRSIPAQYTVASTMRPAKAYLKENYKNYYGVADLGHKKKKIAYMSFEPCIIQLTH